MIKGCFSNNLGFCALDFFCGFTYEVRLWYVSQWRYTVLLCCESSSSLGAARFRFRLFQAPWNLAGTSAAALVGSNMIITLFINCSKITSEALQCLGWNFKAIWWLQIKLSYFARPRGVTNGYCAGEPSVISYAWWRRQMETFSALLTICAGNSPVTGRLSALLRLHLHSPIKTWLQQQHRYIRITQEAKKGTELHPSAHWDRDKMAANFQTTFSIALNVLVFVLIAVLTRNVRAIWTLFGKF